MRTFSNLSCGCRTPLLTPILDEMGCNVIIQSCRIVADLGVGLHQIVLGCTGNRGVHPLPPFLFIFRSIRAALRNPPIQPQPEQRAERVVQQIIRFEPAELQEQLTALDEERQQ